MATRYGCEVVVFVPRDKAWDNDPFRREPGLSLGGKSRRPLADLRAGEVRTMIAHRRAAVESAVGGRS